MLLNEDVATGGYWDGRWATYTGGGSAPCAFASNGAEYATYGQPYPFVPFNFVTVHSNGQNILFCDSHVKWEPATKLMSLGNGGKAYVWRLYFVRNMDRARNNGDVDIML